LLLLLLLMLPLPPLLLPLPLWRYHCSQRCQLREENNSRQIQALPEQVQP